MKTYYPFPGRPENIETRSVTVAGVVLEDSSQEYILDIDDDGVVSVLVDQDVAARKGIGLDKGVPPYVVA